jgi:secreted Zn-dependent insulinase-like peptidase
MMQMQDIMLDQLANLHKQHVQQEHTSHLQGNHRVMMQMQDSTLIPTHPLLKLHVQ